MGLDLGQGRAPPRRIPPSRLHPVALREPGPGGRPGAPLLSTLHVRGGGVPALPAGAGARGSLRRHRCAGRVAAHPGLHLRQPALRRPAVHSEAAPAHRHQPLLADLWLLRSGLLALPDDGLPLRDVAGVRAAAGPRLRAGLPRQPLPRPGADAGAGGGVRAVHDLLQPPRRDVRRLLPLRAGDGGVGLQPLRGHRGLPGAAHGR